jgi:Wiskott-Aldrich syndrome protein
MKKTNWDPYSGQAPPPPPPPRSLVNQKTKPVETFLPPPSRGPSSSSVATQGTSASPGPPPLPARGASSTPPALPQRTNSRDAGPPLPSRTASSIARNSAVAKPAGTPPPVVRSTRPDLVSSESFHSSKEGDSNRIDWTNLSHEDKEAFFSWLDEFFSKHLNITIAPRTAGIRRSVPSSDTGGGLSAPPPLKLAVSPMLIEFETCLLTQRLLRPNLPHGAIQLPVVRDPVLFSYHLVPNRTYGISACFNPRLGSKFHYFLPTTYQRRKCSCGFS